MRDSGHYILSAPLTREHLIDLLNEAINNLDINAARKEVAPFIKDARKLDIWSKDFFRSAAHTIVVI